MDKGSEEANWKKKAKLKIILKIIGVIAAVLAVPATIHIIVNKNDQIIIGNINGDGIVVNQGDNSNINTTINNETHYDINNNISNYIQQNYDFENMNEQELLRSAKVAWLAEDYNYAYDIYILDKLKESRVASINLGYIYANGLLYGEADFQKAEECYLKANCVEAKRNLLALYLDFREDEEKIDALINDLLWQEDDKITWDYMIHTIYDLALEEYTEDKSKENFVYDMSELFEWIYTENYYEGATPPLDNIHSRWIPVGVEWNDLTPYSEYREQQIRYSKYIAILENVYYEEDDNLVPLII